MRPGWRGWWSLPPADALLTTLLLQQQPFRGDTGWPQVDLMPRPNEDGDDFGLVRLQDLPKGRSEKTRIVIEASQCQRIPDQAVHGMGIAPWARPTT